MYYYYREVDPIFQKLSNNTVSVLYDQDIICLEDLFGLSESQILDLYGIGKKRASEILDFLHSLPFDYMDHTLSTNPERNPFLGMHPVLSDHIRNFYRNANDQMFKRGVDYFAKNLVRSITFKNESTETWQADVLGSQMYKVEFSLQKNQTKKSSCTCPAFRNWGYGSSFCKHIVASMLQLAMQQRLEKYLTNEDGTQRYRQLVRSLKSAHHETKLYSSQEITYLLECRNGQWNLYPKPIYGLIKSLRKTSTYNYSFSYKNPWTQVTPKTSKDRIIISHLREQYEQSNYYGDFNKYGGQVVFGDVFELLKDENLKLKHDTDGSETVHIHSEPFRLSLSIKPLLNDNGKQYSGLELQFHLKNTGLYIPANAVEIVSPDPCWVYHSGYLTKLEGSELARKFFLNIAQQHVDVPSAEVGSFIEDLFPILQEANVPVDIDERLLEKKHVEPEPRIYLSEHARELQIEFRIAYGDHEVKGESDQNPLLIPAAVVSSDNESTTLIWSVDRDEVSEQSWLEYLKRSNLTSNGHPFMFTPVTDSLEWVIDYLPGLSESGFKIFGEGELKRFARPKKMTSSSFRISSGEQWFEIEGKMFFGDISLNINDIRKILIRDKPYIQLQDHTTGELPANWLSHLKRLLHLVDPDKDTIRVPKIAANIIDELGRAADICESDPDFQEYANRLRSFEQIEETAPPEKLKGELRPYQQAGLSWMLFLNRYGLGGILADDMGLGKTIQVLALLQKVAESENKKPKCLIIAPRSVLHNWEMEVQKFVPGFDVYIYHGTDRLNDTNNWPDADLFITTYSTMRNDIDQLKNINFDYAILDESHTVRNPASKTFKALKLINAKNRLCMSGTPVQNTTMDLWTQFQFLNPGLLGSQKQFREQWVKPVEKDGNKTAEDMLHSMVSPFILRRTKQQVATDLPPLTSTLVDCPMESGQQVVYEKYRQTYYQLINKSLDAKGIRESRFAVLEGLTRLRQICCSPRLIDGEKAGSAKIKRFIELAEELISEGHRALVFSQFVGFLKLIEDEVKVRGWKYEYLDGKTRDRQKRVDRFQKDSSKDLFLISLKAGGEGLNLTAADYVFIMDPWWNPAAERQAMDRTHRIGQKNNVFVYRFVSPGTVEEKILRLQERKKDIAEKLVVAEAGIFKELNRDDLLALFE